MSSKETKPNAFINQSNPSDSLAQELFKQQALFDIQPPIVQRFLEMQAQLVAVAYIEKDKRFRYSLPDRVVHPETNEILIIPESSRPQVIGNLGDRLSRRNPRHVIRQRLSELESLPNKAISIAAGMIRYCTAEHIITHMLPAGRSVTYRVEEDEEIPSVPVVGLDPESAITASTDAIVEDETNDIGRGNLQVPFVPAARNFFLPQWVAFDDQRKLLVNSIEEADAHVASMQKYLDVLFAARSLAPYVVLDPEFEKKRYGMQGQLVNQGRALAWYKTTQIIETIKRRAAAQSLNRGLGLHLPYFDDQNLQIEYLDFVVIPSGRIMFVPAFVVRAAQEEQVKVSQDTRLNISTRKYLVDELNIFISEFSPKGK